VPTLAPGSRIGPFVARDELGRGGMGTVVAAWDPRLRREIAIKIMQAGATDPAHRARVMREAQALARLADPHVVPVYDVGLQDGALWVAMERVRGPTLAEWTKERRPWTEVVDVFVQAARGLAAAHAAGIVHRDFKPSNAMIGPDGRVMVLDFGLAWAPGVDGARSGGTPTQASEASNSAWGRDPLAYTLTAPGAVVGTPPYMAPEQHERSEVDARADQYALCVALYEALAGVRPFEGELMAIVAAKTRAAPSPPRDNTAPRRVWAVVTRGLAPDPAARWPDMDALAEALEHTRRRPPWIGAALGLSALALVAGGIAARPDDAVEDDRCATLVERVDAYRRGESPDLVQAQLQRAAEGWATMAAGACEGDRVIDRAALECVDGALAAADALVHVVASGGDEAILHASRIAEGLPAPTACDGTEADATIDPDVRRELALGRALARSARHREALDATTRALALATEHADARGSTHALYLRAAVLMDTGSIDDAEEGMRNVLWSSIELGDDQMATTAASKLVNLCVHRMDPGCARPWIRWAEASLARMPEGDAATDARSGFELALGDLAREQGRLDEALEHYETVLDRTIARGPDRNYEIGNLLDAIGVVHAQAGRHERALEMFGRASATFDDLGGPERAASHERMAASLHALGRVAEAREHMDSAIRLLDETYGKEHPHTVRLRGNLVLVLLDEGRPADALELAQSVLETKRRVFGAEHVQIGMALGNVGLAQAALDRHAEAVQSFRASLPLWEQTVGPDHPALRYPLSGLAASALAIGEIEEARTATERALALPGEPTPDLLYTHAAATWATGDREAAVATMQRVATMLPTDAPRVAGRLHHAEATAWLAAHAL
jgi:tetratricopeptide (TPR) repeat protein/predicted Ser/Thr protein kinase